MKRIQIQSKATIAAVSLLCFFLNCCAAPPHPSAPIVDSVSEASKFGPLYASAQIRSFSIEGVHLRMGRGDAIKALQSRGHVLVDSNNDAAWFEDPRGGLTTLIFIAGPQPQVAHVWYRGYLYKTNDAPREQKFIDSYGKPTSEHQEGRARHFIFSPSRWMAVHDQEVNSCFYSWQQAAACSQIDCRPIVKRSASAMMSGYFRDGYLSVELDDYARQAGALVKDPDFKRRELHGETCWVPSVH